MTLHYGTSLALDVARVSVTPRSTYTNDVGDLVGVHWISNVGPPLSWERWTITSIHTESNSDSESQLWVYRRGRPVQGSYSGNFDTSDTRVELQPGEELSFKWENVTYDPQVPTQYYAEIVLIGERLLRGKLLY